MKTRLLVPVIFAFVVLMPILTACNSGTTERDFNFIFKYGITAKNELDTFKNTYTRDMILDPSVTIRLKLTDEELDTILQKMKEINFFDYPDEFSIELAPDSLIGLVTPYASYYFKAEYEGVVKELRWDDEIIWQDERLGDSKDKIFIENKDEAEKLYQLVTLIREIIENRPEYEKLPEPTGGYL